MHEKRLFPYFPEQQVACQWSWPVIFKICLKTGCPVNFFSYFYLC